MSNGEFANIGIGGNSGSLDPPPGSGQVGSGQTGGGSIVPGGTEGDTAEHQNTNNKLALGHKRDSTILVKHDKIRYAQPSNISHIVSK